ncbi:IS4 family transposase [Natrinema ejinorense]|uniref:IS4 family transposase n=1 Tax=Natrinema ejinorense TaxID=373386 RepID=A0A2A5QUG2_9EURY|nr:IS4 family transposase [Natrinema ejinorense]PCR90399.1 IS4 family transposase [Natrinema ejinorense]
MQSGSLSWRSDGDDESELRETDVSGKVRKEFQSAELGDDRLTDRLIQVGDRLVRAPAESIPNACEDWAFTKATYRFCDNESVDPNEILDAHKRAQRSRIRGKEELLVVSDTTELVFPRHPSKEGLGDIGNSKTDLEGVKVHSTIGLDPQTHRMTGVIDQQSLIEDQQASTKHDANGKDEPIELESEQEKWIRGDRQASHWLVEEVRPIFIHDRGADAFAFYHEVTDDLDAGFIVRANQNRCIQTPSGTDGRLIDWSENLPEQGRTSLEIGRGNGRKAREAELTIKAGSCELLPPQNDPTHTEPVKVNVVRIDELGEQNDPIQWVLLTTESVTTFSDSLTVVDSYRARWTIEDWHKVLKTGCRIEERRLETWERMEVLLSIYSVIAWKVLELRELARGEVHHSPEVLLTETERSILETKFPELTDNGPKAYAIAVAKIGGYLDRGSDPPPGWETMWKGLKKLQTLAEGYELHS